MEEPLTTPPRPFVPKTEASPALAFVEAQENYDRCLNTVRASERARSAAMTPLLEARVALGLDSSPQTAGAFAQGFRAGEKYRAWYQHQFENIESEHKALRAFAQSVAEAIGLDSPLMITARAVNDEETTADIVLRVLRERLGSLRAHSGREVAS